MYNSIVTHLTSIDFFLLEVNKYVSKDLVIELVDDSAQLIVPILLSRIMYNMYS